MPEAWIASMTSPEQGAQHECSSSLSAPFGSVSCGRLKSAFFINGCFGNSETFRNFSIHIGDNEIKKSLLSLNKGLLRSIWNGRQNLTAIWELVRTIKLPLLAQSGPPEAIKSLSNVSGREADIQLPLMSRIMALEKWGIWTLYKIL